MDADTADECLDVLEDEGEVVIEPVANVTAVYLRRLHEAETYTAARLRSMAGEELSVPIDTDELISTIERENGSTPMGSAEPSIWPPGAGSWR